MTFPFQASIIGGIRIGSLKKAFRKFKDEVFELDIRDDWFRFKNEKLKDIAEDWCRDNGIVRSQTIQ